MEDGNNQGNISRNIGDSYEYFKSPTEGHDANGRPVQIIKEEFPTRIDEVNDTLFYIGWAVLGSSESDDVWKIKKIEQIDTVWKETYANGNQFYRNKWIDRDKLTYY